MKNKAIDLHNILFEQLERLSDEDIKGEELLEEIKRAEAMNKVAGQIISNGSMVLKAIQINNEYGIEELPDMFFTNQKQLPKPAGK
ncbi:MAG: hypothetical protein FWC24_06045 [Treponema sp.]|nr:hypothetical protein [Treponema sp.]